MMDIGIVLGIALAGGGFTAALILLHKRIEILEVQVLSTAQAGLNLANALKFTADTQGEILKLIKTSVDKQNESSTT